MQLVTEAPTWLTPTLYNQGYEEENFRLGKGNDSMKCLHVSRSLIAAGFVDMLTVELTHSFFHMY